MEDNNNPKDPFEDFQIVTSLSDLDFEENKPADKPSGGMGAPEDRTDDQDNQGAPESDPRATAYYELLKEEGMIMTPENYEFDGTFEGLKKLQEQTYQYQYQMAQDQLINSMPERLRDIVQAGLNGVNDIDSLINLKRDLDVNPDISTETSQKNLIRNELSGTISEDDLDELIEMYVDKGKLETEAKKILTKRQNEASTRIEQMQLEAKEQQRRYQEQVQQFQNTLNQEITAQPWDAKRKQLVMSELTQTIQGTPMIEAKLNKILTDPKTVVVLADFLSYYNGETFNLDDYRKINSQEAENLRNKWASKLSDTPANLRERQQSRGAVSLDDFELYPG